MALFQILSYKSKKKPVSLFMQLFPMGINYNETQDVDCCILLDQALSYLVMKARGPYAEAGNCLLQPNPCVRLFLLELDAASGSNQ